MKYFPSPSTVFLSFAFGFVLESFRNVSGSTISSVWTHPESNQKERHPLQWLQQHFPTLFGADKDGSSKQKNHKKNSKEAPHTYTDRVASRRRALYEYTWKQHTETLEGPTTEAQNVFDYYAHAPLSDSFPPFPPSLRAATLQKIRDMFTHAYDGYYYHAWPHGELLPISCAATNFSLVKLPALTAIDALDTFWVMGNTTELVRTVERLRQLQDSLGTSLWNVDQNVSVFETTIRVLGGLLSAHQILVDAPTVWHHEIWDPVTGAILDGRIEPPPSNLCPVPPPLVCAGIKVADCWTGQPTASSCQAVNDTRRRSGTTAVYQYDGILLEMAVDMGNRLLPAFDTATGIPYGTVHLQEGVPVGETPVASLAGAGTLVLEWELLSQLSGNPVYGRAARLAARALWQRQTSHRLVGKHIDSRNGNWVESLSGIGSNSDSFIEYLVKYCFVFLEDNDFPSLWRAIYDGVHEHMRKGDWYVDVDSSSPSHTRNVMESLMAFFPGLQIWLGEWGPAARSLNAFFVVREYLGFLPERFSLSTWKADGPTYPLRPELLESNYLMHRAVKDFSLPSPFSNHSSSSSGWLWAAAWSVEKLEDLKTPCGYATLAKVDPSTTGQIGSDTRRNWRVLDDMPSFFLSETLKYLYLTFDEENPLHTDDDRQWMFTTEAHPFHLPTSEVSREDLVQLEQILFHRKKGKKASRPSGRMASDHWAEKTPMKEFLNQLWPIELETKRRAVSALPDGSFFFRDRELFGGVDEGIDLHDDWKEYENRENLAHLKFSATGVGSGSSLRSACPNFHASELVWIHALNGEGLDYRDEFVPVDNVGDQQAASRNPVVYGSVEALDHLHMQYTSAQLRKSKGCLIQDLKAKESSRNDDDKDDTAPEADSSVKVETKMGAFQYLASPDGTGFTIVRESDGYNLNVSFLVGGPQNVIQSVMLHSTGGQNNDSPRGDVSVADFSGNTFACHVSLLKIPRENNSLDDDEKEEILRVPCVSGFLAELVDLTLQFFALVSQVSNLLCFAAQTPAMFGPAHMSNLVRSHGSEIVAPVYLPPGSDSTGCKASSHFTETQETAQSADDLPVCTNTNIQMIVRGECSFATKALNQKMSRDADAMIVINTEDELFTMAPDPEIDSLDAKQTPLTVMISKNHGQELLVKLQAHADEQHQIIGRVALTHQPNPDELETLEDPSSLHLPLVHGSQSGLHIYAPGFWGAHATVKDGQWHVLLVEHRLG